MTEHDYASARADGDDAELDDDDDVDVDGLLETMFTSVSVGDTTPDYWYGALDRSIAQANATGNRAAAEQCRALKLELQEALSGEAQFVAVSRTVAYRRLRKFCRVIIPRGRRRARASHRRVGARTASKASATGDPDPEPPSRRTAIGGAP